MNFRVPFNKPFIVGKELYYIAQSVLQLKTSGDGLFTKKSQDLLKKTFGAYEILLTTSCTAALDLAAILADIKDGDEIILPSFTFSSTANAFLLRGARPIFVDCRRDTLNIDEKLVEAAVTPKTRAIVPVHYAGVGCEMDAIMSIAAKHHLIVIEDAAQGVNATYNGKYLGTIGDIGTYSFHETKNFICGEGGAIVLNGPKLVERAEIIREKGTNRSSFFRGEVDKYTWVDIGSSLLPSDILAGFLFAQLENMDIITRKREAIYRSYEEGLRPLAVQGHITLPVVPNECHSNYHMFYVILNSLDERSRLIEYLKAEGILALFHYVPLHTSPMGRARGYRPGMLPVTEAVSDCLLRLPMYYEMRESEVNLVVEEIFKFFRG